MLLSYENGRNETRFMLRSLNDYVNDEMSDQAMKRINRDESRHIAIDYHMAEHYASDEYRAGRASRPPPAMRQRVRAWWAFAGVLTIIGGL